MEANSVVALDSGMDLDSEGTGRVQDVVMASRDSEVEDPRYGAPFEYVGASVYVAVGAQFDHEGGADTGFCATAIPKVR